MRHLRTATGAFLNPSNRFGVDYRAEAASFAPPPVPIVDAHSHVHGTEAARILRDSMDLYGIERIHSMTRLADVESIRGVLGDRIRFIAVPDFGDPDRRAGVLRLMVACATARRDAEPVLGPSDFSTAPCGVAQVHEANGWREGQPEMR
jgi:hypothetical protein